MVRYSGKENKSAIIKNYLYVFPAILFLVLFTLYPVLRSGYLSFFNTDSVFSFMDFVGFKHFCQMFASKVFREVCINTLIYGVLQVILSTFVGFLLALVANSKKNKLKSIFKVSFFYPYILPWSVVAMIWMYFLHPTRGLINTIFNTRIQWLNDSDVTLLVLVFISVWKTVGFNFLLFLSGMQSIPNELYEALALENSSSLKAIKYITLPMLEPTTFATVLLSIVGSFQSVDLIYILTQGRPGNSTNVLIYYIYQEGITNWNIGYGSALSTFLFICLLIFTIIYIRFGEGKVEYDK